jgi:hypothetical protein
MRPRTRRTVLGLVLTAATGASALLLLACGGTRGTVSGATRATSASRHTTHSTSQRSAAAALSGDVHGPTSVRIGASPSRICAALTEAMAVELLSTHELVRKPPSVEDKGPHEVTECGYEHVIPNATGHFERTIVALQIGRKNSTSDFTLFKTADEQVAREHPEDQTHSVSGIGSTAFASSGPEPPDFMSIDLYFLVHDQEFHLDVGAYSPSLSKLESAAKAIAAAV